MELEDNPETVNDKEWHGKVLFRHNIDADCALFIEISQAIKKNVGEKLLLNVIGNLSGTGIIQIPIVGSAANSILKDDISKYFDELAEDKILKIAEGLYPGYFGERIPPISVKGYHSFR